ncbi:hypothetical protein KBB68_02345 [Candidatus Babeliales bacterium]|nr:hypothetical protein [Candidatus Babeliales bacterium]
MKRQIILLIFLTMPIFLTTEMELPEFANLKPTLDPEKSENARIQKALRQKAEKNYQSKFFADARRAKYLKNVNTLSAETQRLLVSPDAHEFSTKADVDRLNQEIAHEKNRSSKLWFNGDKSGTLIKDLQDLKRNLQKKQIEKIVKARKAALSEKDNASNVDKTLPSPAERYFETKDEGSKLENNPLSPKNNFDYDAWKKSLLEKQTIIEDEQKQINKKITALKKQEAYQKDRLLDVHDQKKEIFKQYTQKTLTPTHIDYIATEIIKHQTEVQKIEQERLNDFKFKTFGIHPDNEKLQELKAQITTWKDELNAYDQLQELKEREKTILEKIKNIQNQQKQQNIGLNVLNDQWQETNNSLNNADFHLKRINKYLNKL